jgi:hypothetical protein
MDNKLKDNAYFGINNATVIEMKSAPFVCMWLIDLID